jgi:serine/threonine protein kinase
MDRLGDLLLEWEDRRDRGEPVSPASLCPDDPALAAELAERARLLQAFENLLGDSSDPETRGTERPDPERIGKYEIRCVLGRGGMGVVYRGWDPALRRPVAVKTIRFLHALRVERFEREGHVLAQLKHPNIVGVYEAGTHAGEPFLAMEYVSGGSLADHKERLTTAGPAAIVRLGEKVARAVQFAHDRGVLHRDLKPANILLGPADEPLVADFGLAKMRDPEPGPAAPADAETVPDGGLAALTGTAQPGTPAYMAPEQFDPSVGPVGPVGPATDVWALGVILYEVATGERPFKGADYAELARGVRRAPDFSKFRGRRARRLAAVIARCLQPEPGQRYGSAGELASALQPPRRFRIAILVPLVVGLVALAIWLTRGDRPMHQEKPGPDPFEYVDAGRVEETLAKLGRGQSVALVDQGVPRHYRILPGPNAGTVTPDSKDGFRVYAREYCVVELLPHLPPGDWVIEADLRHELSLAGCVFGLCAGTNPERDEDGRHVSGYAAVLVPIPSTRGYTARSQTFRVGESNTRLFPGEDVTLGKFHPIPAEQGDEVRRAKTLTIRVTTDTLLGSIGELQLEPFPPSRGKLPAAPISVRGGIGLYGKFGVFRADRVIIRRSSPRI